LIEGEGVLPDRIFVGTFTRAVAADLIEALREIDARDEDGGETGKPQISTLHALALRLLHQHPTACPGRRFRFLLGYEQECMLYDIGLAHVSFPSQDDREKELRKILGMWAGSTALADEAFKGSVTNWLTLNGGMLIDEVVYLAVRALHAGDIDAGAFDHVIVDEYQDLTLCEQTLVDLVRSPSGSVVVLGDDDQSVYGFRFNHPGGITAFPETCDPADLEQVTISFNRRCGDKIVDLANRLMAMAGSKKPPMRPSSGITGEVNVLRWPSVKAEVEGLARYISAEKERSFLVLVPRRFIGHALRERIGDDARTSFHEEILQHPLVRERFALASLVANLDDTISLRAWLGLDGAAPGGAPKRNAPAVASLLSTGLRGLSLIRGIAGGEVRVNGAGQKNVKMRAARLLSEIASAPSTTVDESVRHWFDPNAADVIEDSTERSGAQRDLLELQEAASSMVDEYPSRSLLDVVDRLRYRISTRMSLLDGEEDVRVRIMTLHGAKGLEADNIIVAGLADQMLPGPNEREPIDTQAKHAEQLRLLYVAVTRARANLIISRPQSVEYGVAQQNQIRIDPGAVRRVHGTHVVKLSGTRFLPTSVVQSVDGRDWLSGMDIPSNDL
jgi:superfamily I DNA/RNA helicase